MALVILVDRLPTLMMVRPMTVHAVFENSLRVEFNLVAAKLRAVYW